MKKELIIFIFFLVITPLVSSVTLTDISLNESISVNGTVNLQEITINDNSIKLYNLTSAGNFTNNGATSNILSFYNLTDPYNDIYWFNNTLIEENATDKNVTIPSGETIKVKSVTPSAVVTPVGGGGGTVEIINLDHFEIMINDWFKNEENTLFIYTYNDKDEPIDVSSIDFEIENVSLESSYERLNIGVYKGKILILDDVSEISLKIMVKDGSKTLEDFIEIKLKESNFWQKLISNVKIKTKDLFLDKVFLIILSAIAFTVLLIILVRNLRK